MERNFKLTIGYDGSGFSGFELQPGKKTIRGEIEKALQKAFKQQIKIISASRTDAGVHALGLVVNFKVAHPIPAKKILFALNSLLPQAIRVINAQAAKDKFNARFDAKRKEYEYLIYNGPALPPFLINFAWQVKPKLDLSAMRQAARLLIGKHDFSSFCASGGDDKNFDRTIYKITVKRRNICIFNSHKLSVISYKFMGNGFLYKMVRNMVGTLVEVGLGRISVDEVKKILSLKDRKKAGRTAPPQGLCLLKVSY